MPRHNKTLVVPLSALGLPAGVTVTSAKVNDEGQLVFKSTVKGQASVEVDHRGRTLVRYRLEPSESSDTETVDSDERD